MGYNNDIHNKMASWRYISKSVLALKDLCTKDVLEHSLHSEDPFKNLGYSVEENVHS